MVKAATAPLAVPAFATLILTATKASCVNVQASALAPLNAAVTTIASMEKSVTPMAPALAQRAHAVISAALIRTAMVKTSSVILSLASASALVLAPLNAAVTTIASMEESVTPKAPALAQRTHAVISAALIWTASSMVKASSVRAPAFAPLNAAVTTIASPKMVNRNVLTGLANAPVNAVKIPTVVVKNLTSVSKASAQEPSHVLQFVPNFAETLHAPRYVDNSVLSPTTRSQVVSKTACRAALGALTRATLQPYALTLNAASFWNWQMI